jgi:CRP/FNR family transcriptional regulator
VFHRHEVREIMDVSHVTQRYEARPAPRSERIRRAPPDLFELLRSQVPLRRHAVRAGAAVYRSGTALNEVHIVRAGVFKVAVVTWDGREKLLALRFRGQWLGFDGIADARHVCDATATEEGELWSMRYDELLLACVRHAPLGAGVHRAMSEEMAHDRDSMKSLSTLSADARVAKFLCSWVETQSRHGARPDRITLHLTRAEIGNYLGLTLESVSRAFSRLAREKVIGFAESTHREVEIRDAGALSRFTQAAASPLPPQGALAC